MKARYYLICLLLLLLTLPAAASHIVGGEVTYKYLGAAGGLNKYQVNVTIYEDCLNGQAGAIAMDNPAYLALYHGGGDFVRFDSVDFDASSTGKVPVNFSNSCVSNIPEVCLLKKTFIINYTLAPSASGYVVSYQRCCRNASILNIQNPGDIGATYFCTIPPDSLAHTNTSAVFKNYPPQIICLNNPLNYDNSATDADGDSLSYEFCNTLAGASDNDIKPKPPLGPPFRDSVVYVSPTYSYRNPITGFPPLQINPATGLITGTPNRLGRYLVTVCCNEWRNGVLINTVKREFQFVVTNCTKVVVANIPQYSADFNTYIIDCSDYTVHFTNTSTGGFSYHWDFGVPGAADDTSADFEPTFTYPDSGVYTLKLVVNPGSTCPDSIVRLVKVYPKFHADFSDSGKNCPGTPIFFTDLSSSSIKPIVYWKWNFGDGDSTFTESPVHTYTAGGIYNVTLISDNVRDCVDTATKQVLIQNFRPFAGNDTIIVKGETVYFFASGGTSYGWSPATYLSDTAINNPVGHFPDTGIFNYTVHVTTAIGCQGYDTVKVQVVNQAAFFVPTGFSPNGDGKNDIFTPIAIGYTGLNYFRVFNRYGQAVYDGKTLEQGWDGTYNGKAAEIGTYYWEISFIDRFGGQGALKGDVTLVR